MQREIYCINALCRINWFPFLVSGKQGRSCCVQAIFIHTGILYLFLNPSTLPSEEDLMILHDRSESKRIGGDTFLLTLLRTMV